jgi:hypothetical protein
MQTLHLKNASLRGSQNQLLSPTIPVSLTRTQRLHPEVRFTPLLQQGTSLPALCQYNVHKCYGARRGQCCAVMRLLHDAQLAVVKPLPLLTVTLALVLRIVSAAVTCPVASNNERLGNGFCEDDLNIKACAYGDSCLRGAGASCFVGMGRCHRQCHASRQHQSMNDVLGCGAITLLLLCVKCATRPLYAC